MRLAYLIISIWIAVAACTSVYSKISNVIKDSPVDKFSDSILNKLQATSSLLLISNILSPHDMIDKNYRILALQKGNWYAIKYIVKDVYVTGQLPYVYNEKLIEKSVGDSIVSVFINNKFWQIKKTDEGCEEWEYKDIRNSCGRGGSSPHYQLILSYQLKQITKTYFQPEFYETECCPGNKDRQIFVKCYNAINSQFITKP